jgi:hypothetical protein
MFFSRGDVFRRRRFGGHGDRNHFMVVGDETLHEWLRDTASFHRAFGIPPSCVRKRTLPPYV